MSHLPTWIYHPKEVSKVVHTQDDLDSHLQDGWQLTPALAPVIPEGEAVPVITLEKRLKKK